MPDPQNPPAGAVAGQPAGGTTTPPAEAPTQDKAGESERQGLRERAIAAERELATLRDAAKKAEDAKLAEQGKFQELAKSKEAEAGTWKAKYESAQRNNALIAAGAKAGVNDPSDLAALVNLSGIDASDESGLHAAAEKAVADLKTSKPYLFGNGKGAAPFTTPTPNPGGSPGVVVPKGVKAGDVANLTKEQKQALVSEARGAANGSGGFFRK